MNLATPTTRSKWRASDTAGVGGRICLPTAVGKGFYVAEAFDAVDQVVSTGLGRPKRGGENIGRSLTGFFLRVLEAEAIWEVLWGGGMIRSSSERSMTARKEVAFNNTVQLSSYWTKVQYTQCPLFDRKAQVYLE